MPRSTKGKQPETTRTPSVNAQSVGKAPDTPGPRKYSDKIADEIIERLSLGETLTRICRDPMMPDQSTVGLWRRDDPVFARRFAQARIDQLSAWADQCVDLADTSAVDYVRDEDGKIVLDQKDRPVEYRAGPQRSRLQIEARQWLMERLNSEEYGLRQQVDMTTSISMKDDRELAHELREALQAAGMKPEDLVAMLQPGALN